MKEFDIYLKEHIHETKLFIYSIPYRDGVSATNRLIMEAMLGYYTLQKVVAAQNQSELTAEIDEIINIVREKIDASVGIQSKADFLTRYFNVLESEAIQLNISNLPSFMKSFFAVENLAQMRISDIDAIAKSSLGDMWSEVTMEASCADVIETVAEIADNDTAIAAKVKRTHKQAFETLHGEVPIDTPDLNLFYCYAVGAEAAFSLAANIVDMEIHYSLGKANNKFSIMTSAAETNAKKAVVVSDEINIFCQMAAAAISYFQPEADFTMNLSGSAGLKRYRLLNEMDDFALNDLDNFSLGELDYVELV